MPNKISFYLKLLQHIAMAIVLLMPDVCDAFTFVRDAESEDIIASITNPIFSTAGLKGQSKIIMIQDDDLNAFVTSGHYVFINTGLLTFKETPDALAGVIAHETAHIKEGHVMRGNDQAKNLTGASMVGIIAGIAAAAAGGGDPNIGVAIAAGSAEAASRNMMGYVLTQENSADMLAVELMKKLNVSNAGLIEMLQSLDKDSRATNSLYGNKRPRTHPLIKERIDFLRRNPTYNPTKEELLLTSSMRHKFAMAAAKIYAFTQPASATMRRYNTSSAPSAYAQSIALYRSHRSTEAMAKLDALLKHEPSNPYFHELKGQFYLENGRLQDAVSSYSKANTLHPRSALIQTEFAIALILSGKKDHLHRAIALLQAASNTERNNIIVWREMAKAYGKLGDAFAYQVMLAKQYSMIDDEAKRDKFINFAKKQNMQSSDKFAKQIYQDLTLSQNTTKGR